MKLVKFLLFLFNFIFWLAGLALIVFGVVIKIQNSNYYNYLGNSFLAASIILIVGGCIIAILGFFGCCGAIRENYCMTMTFAILLGLMIVLELAAGIAAYVLRAELEGSITKHITDGMNNYVNSTHPADPYKKSMDYVQQKLNCCGAINYTDWESKEAFRTVNLGPKGGRLLPVSCCASATEADSCYTTAENLHTIGCLEQLKKWAEINVGYMGGIGVGLAFIQILGIGFACCLSKSILKDYDDYYY